jgi:uncharacterized metal-binding protein YceD (DUF177 family)
MSEAKPLPFSRPLLASNVPPEGLEATLRPNETECAALARDNGLVALKDLEARLRITRRGADGLVVKGAVRAKVRQICVVTLEEFEADVDEPVEVIFAPPADASRRSRTKEPEDEASFDEFGEDAPDPILDGAIDLGAVVAEFLTLGLDLYPRSPGATFVEPAPEDARDGPFANLRGKLKESGT